MTTAYLLKPMAHHAHACLVSVATSHLTAECRAPHVCVVALALIYSDDVRCRHRLHRKLLQFSNRWHIVHMHGLLRWLLLFRRWSLVFSLFVLLFCFISITQDRMQQVAACRSATAPRSLAAAIFVSASLAVMDSFHQMKWSVFPVCLICDLLLTDRIWHQAVS